MVAKKTAKKKDAEPVDAPVVEPEAEPPAFEESEEVAPLPIVNDADQSVAAIAPEPKKQVKDDAPPLVKIAEKAWNKVKGNGDAVFAECQPYFVWTLMAHAESVQKTHSAQSGDTYQAKFEREVQKLIGE